MNPPDPDQALVDRIEQQRATPRLPRSLSAIPARVRLALALLPTSTCDALASLDPSAQGRVVSALEALGADGLVEADLGALPSTAWALRSRTGGLTPELRPAASLRQRLLDEYSEQYGGAGRSARALREACADIGAALEQGSTPLPETTRRWAHLAAGAVSTGVAASAARLDAAVQAAADRGDSADVSRWIDAAQPLAALLERDKDPSLTLGVERAGRQLELLRREHADRRHLATFYPRREQIAAIDACLDDRSGRGRWMLHLLGSGGVGKTMLIRHLTLDMARERGFVSARVDFDFLSPDYPRLDPGLLLWSLGRELQLRTTDSEAVRTFKDAEAKFRHLSEVLHGARGADEGRPTRHPAFVEATAQFISALRMTSGPSLATPIVLVLDTCEELVKGRARGGAADPVIETFRILHALRYGAQHLLDEELVAGTPVTNLRVVFAGRRPLAAIGAGWSAGSDLPSRLDLEVFELRGFSRAEAEEWLTERLDTPRDLVSAVIEATPDMDPGARVTWTDGRPAPELGKNPYDLKHFAEWAKEVPPPTREVLTSGSTRQYVEQRILSKLEHSDLARFLPVLAVLKQVDRTLLEAVVPMERFGERFDTLVAHEWIVRRVVSDEDGRTRVIYHLEERLRQRLRRYFSEQGVELGELAARAAPALAAATLERDLAFVDVADVDAALRAFEFDVSTGRAWWRTFVERVTTERDFAALLRFTDFLLGDEQAAGKRAVSPQAPAEHPLRAQVLGDQAAALARTGALVESDRDWAAVLEMIAGSDRSPDEPRLAASSAPPVRERTPLSVRATMGRIAARAPRADFELLAQLVTAWRLVTSLESQHFAGLSPAFLAALEAIVERIEVLGSDAPAAKPLLTSLVDTLGPATDRLVAARQPHGFEPVVAMWSSLLLRVSECARDTTSDLRARAKSLRQHAFGTSAQYAPILDWAPPTTVPARVLLESLRLGEGGDDVVAGASTIDYALSRLLADGPQDDDHDRLSSLALTWCAREALPLEDTRWVALVMRAIAIPLPDRASVARPLANAHRLVPPLAVTGARLACECGALAKGLSTLIAAAGNEALDRFVREHAARALAQLAPLLRRSVWDLGVLDESTSPEDAWAVVRARFVCAPLDAADARAALRRFVEDRDPLAAYIRPPDASALTEPAPIPPRERWRLAPALAAARCGPLRDSRRAAHIERIAQGFPARERARAFFDAGDVLGFVDRDEAERLLEQASRTFAGAHDLLGVFAAEARRAVLCAGGPSARDPDALESALTRCQGAYEGVLKAAPDERWPAWADIEEGEPLVSRAGSASSWPFRLALCFVRLRELQKAPSRRESLFPNRRIIFLMQGATADALQLLGRDPWNGDTGAEETEPDWLDSMWWRLVEKWPSMRRLIAALLLVVASFVRSWIRFTSSINPRTGAVRSPKDALVESLERTAARIDVPEPAAATVAASPPGPGAAPAEAAVFEPADDETLARIEIPKTRIAPAMWELIPILLGGAIVAAVVVGGFLLTRPVLSSSLKGVLPPPAARGSWLALAGEISAYAVLLTALLFAIGVAVGMVNKARKRRTRLVLQVESANTDALSAVLGAGLILDESRFPRAGHTSREIGRGVWPIDLLSPPGPEPAEINLRDAVQTHLSTPRIVIRSSGTLASRAPWEALVATALDVPPEQLRVSRWGQAAAAFTGVASSTAQYGRTPPDVFVLTGHEASGRIAEDVWESLAAAVHVTRPTWPMGVEIRSTGTFRVVHLIGEVESRGAEVRLRPAAQGATLGVTEIAQMFGTPALLVLQGPLRPQLTQREDSDRLDAASQRDLGHRLHETGMPIVLVLPRLDTGLTNEILTLLTRRLARRGAGVDPLLDAVSTMRGAICTRGGDTADARERASDICLFAIDGWNERVLR